MNAKIRSVIFWIHLTVGVLAGIVVLIMSVTGVLLTYEKQMVAWADSGYRATPPAAGAPRLPAETLIAKIREARPKAPVTTLTYKPDPTEPVVVGAGRDSLYFDPYSGALLGAASPGMRSFFQSVTGWHRWLAVQGDGRTTARAITGASNLGFLFLVVSGLYLWLPRRWTRQAVRAVALFNTRATGKARDFNWHHVFGFWLGIPLFFVVASAVVISYPWASNLVYRVVGEEPPARAAGPGGPGAGGPGAAGAGGPARGEGPREGGAREGAPREAGRRDGAPRDEARAEGRSADARSADARAAGRVDGAVPATVSADAARDSARGEGRGAARGNGRPEGRSADAPAPESRNAEARNPESREGGQRSSDARAGGPADAGPREGGPREGGSRRGDAAPVSLDGLEALVVRASAKVDGWRTLGLRVPASADAPVVFTIDRGYAGQPQLRGTLTLEARTGRELRWETFDSLSAGRQLRSWTRFVHTGEYYGLVGQTIAGIASFAGAVLVYTGLALSLRRLVAFIRRRNRAAVDAASTATRAA